jgi:PAS domain S-box-containing protein
MGRSRRFCLILMIAFLGVLRLPAAPKAEAKFDIDYIGTDQGLLHDNVSAVLQTRDGYLWIGTDGGLSRYDGITFTTYRIRLTPGLVGDTVRSLFEDSAGVLWIGTSRGLCRFDGRQFETVLNFDDTSAVMGISEDTKHRIWIAASNHGVMRSNGRIFESLSSDPLLRGKTALSVFSDSSGRTWIGLMATDGAVCYDDAQFKLIDATGFTMGIINGVQESPRGTLWFATRGAGLVRLRDGQFSRIGADTVLSKIISKVYADGAGSIWIASLGLQRCNEDGTGEMETVVRLGSPSIRQVIRDREGSLWVAAYGDGLLRVRPARYKILNSSSGLPADFVRTVAQEPSGGLVFAQGAVGAVRVAPDGTTTRLRPPGKARDRDEALTVLTTRAGETWVGMQSALFLWRGTNVTEFPEFPAVRSLFEDTQGRIWLGTYDGGLRVIRDDVVSKFDLPEAVVRCTPCSFAEDSDGTLYAATMQHGLLRIKGDKVDVINDHNGLPDDSTRAVYIDSDRNVWVGSKAGMSVFSHGRWWYQPWICDVLDQYVTGIVQIPGDNLLLSTSRGVIRVSRLELLAALQHEKSPGHLQQAIVTEAARTGNIGTACFPSQWTSRTGEVWIAARKGAIVIDPKKISVEQDVPPVRIEHLVADGMTFTSLDHAHLRAGVRQLRIDYTALTFVQPNRVRFAYRLKGYEDQWVDAGPRRVAFYNTLPPGEYLFQVKACNSEGVWNDDGASLSFTVPPLFYQMLWFRLGVVVVLGVVILTIYRWRVRLYRRKAAELQNQNLELERRIAERTGELAKSFEALRRSENFYHSLIESLPQIIVRKDTESRFTYANSAFSELIGRPLDQIIGRPESDFYPPEEAARFRVADQRVMETRQVMEFESVIERNGRKNYLHVKKVPILNEQKQPIGVQVLFWDMTVFRDTEEKLRQAQTELIETSRLAGMAEVATGVLHNIGNALNSVNVSASLALNRVRQSRAASLAKVAQMLTEQGDRLAEFFAQDPRAAKVPPYLTQLGENLDSERVETLRELESLHRGLDHLKEIVAAQQSYARASGITENVSPSDLLEQALKISDAHMSSRDIEIIRQFLPTPRVTVQRQQVLQVLVNLIRNAKESMKESGCAQPRLTLAVGVSPLGQVTISVTDNGGGIAPANLTRIFGFGFTTKKAGHGFGLHSSALVAKELGGSLMARSEGLGQGATFVLELPVAEAQLGVAVEPEPAVVSSVA